MAKYPKLIICRTCNNTIAVKAKVCPYCGAKNRKPIYKRGWFVALAVIILLSVIISAGEGNKTKGEKISWKDIELESILPEPKSKIGRIIINSDDHLSIYIQKTSKNDYKDYVSKCQDEGFTTESDKADTHYSAYNENGYELYLWYNESDKELSIRLDAPMDMDTLKWPASDLVSLIPVPKSSIGRISNESSDRFFVYVGKTSLADYHDYVSECSAAGFSVNYEKGDKFYYADNDDGYHLSLRYTGNNVMSVEVEKPEETPEIEEPEINTPEETPEIEEPDTNTPKEDENQSAQINNSSSNKADTTKPEEPKQEITYTAYTVSQMMSDLNGNAMNASDTYKNQYIEITGRLSVIDSRGKYISLLPADNEFAFIGVHCIISTDEQRDAVKKMTIGDIVTLRGKCTDVGEILGYYLEIDSIA